MNMASNQRLEGLHRTSDSTLNEDSISSSPPRPHIGLPAGIKDSDTHDWTMGTEHIERRNSASVAPREYDSPSSEADTFVSHPMANNQASLSTSALETSHNKALRVAPPIRRRPYGEHGALIDRSMTAEEISGKPTRYLLWPRIRRALREPLGEFMGVFIMIMFGDGVVAQVTLSSDEKGNYQSISWGWGLGVMLGV